MGVVRRREQYGPERIYGEGSKQRQFGLWAGETTQQEVDGTDSPRAVNILDRPDCLEDVFALVSCMCDVYPAGAKSFWHIVDKEERPGEEGSSMNEEGSVGRTLVLEPSSTLQMLDILQSASNAAFFVYLSFLALLALSDAPGGVTDEGNNGASAVHSFLSGEVTINPPAVAERRIHFVWAQIFSAVRWYAEHLSSGEEGDGVEKKTSRIKSTTPTAESSSTSYYYGVGNSGSTSGGGGGDASSSEQGGRPNNQHQGGSDNTMNTVDSKTKALDEDGRNTLMALLCVTSNVASSEVRERLLISLWQHIVRLISTLNKAVNL